MAAFESKRFSWRPGYAYRVSADVVGGVLETIEQRDGEVSSRSFLDYSRPEGSETHSLFLWNDAEAAEKYRLEQAARIINQLEVQIEYAETEAEEKQVRIVPAYVNTLPKGSPMVSARFLNVTYAMEDPDTRRVVINNALRELKAFHRKYASITAFSKLFAAVEELEEKLKADAV